jgi:uncharacterized protein YdbL (DUF1318 family)
MKRWAFLAALVLAAPGAAQTPTLSAAIASGQVGERYDGYMGLAAPAPDSVRRQVNAINIRRRNLYIELASRRNVTAQVVGLATACQLFERLSVGEAYMLGDGSWRRRMPGQAAPEPDYCKR